MTVETINRSEPVSITRHTYRQLVNLLDISQTPMDSVAEHHASYNQEVVENVANAFEQMANIELTVKQLSKSLFMKTFQDRGAKGEKTTEAVIDSLVETNADVMAMKSALIVARTDHMRWEGLLDSYRERRNGYQQVSEYVRGGYKEYRK